MRQLLRLFTGLLVLVSAAAGAEPSDVQQRRMKDVLASLQAGREPEAVYAPGFRTAVPEAQLAALVRQLESQHGALRSAEYLEAQTSTTARFTLRFERATASAIFSIEVEPPNRVTGLRITTVTPTDDSAEKIAAELAALPGRTGFTVVQLGAPRPIIAANADTQFAIGSTFKLWVLDALAGEIAAGRLRWDEVVELGPASLPSGMTQDWPANAPMTVQTLATLMIAISDNTATDTLIRLVGRERIAERVRSLGHAQPSRTLPFLTTAEAFAIKLSPPALREAYARADDAAQARMLADLDVAKVLASGDMAALSAPTAVDSVEWFASSEDVVRMLDSLRRRGEPRVLQILGVAPTLPEDLRRPFAYVGYKGGSEAGVINLSWLLQAHSGEWFAVTASWNDPAATLDNDRFVQLAHRLVRLVAKHASQP